jgi:fumarylacetoacetase
MTTLNKTHSAELKSWVDSANRKGSDFPIQNLPFGVFSHTDLSEAPQIGVAIGTEILDLRRCAELGLLDSIDGRTRNAVRSTRLNELMSLGHEASSEIRSQLSHLLDERNGELRDDESMRRSVLVPSSSVELHLPVEIGDYTDFYTSSFHATNVGSMFRPDNPLLPNYKYLPVGYHGRASSIVVSGTEVRRPRGQRETRPALPEFGPSGQLDYELEVGCFVRGGNRLGERIPIEKARQSIFGLCLVNDWSARDIQRWEYQPLGPFLAKSFATSISPWVVTLEALEPFRTKAFPRPDGDPEILPHLLSKEDQASGGFAIWLEAYLSSQQMRERGMDPVQISKGSFADMYWTLAQMVAHHTSNGCNLRAGDLIASGTVSGPTKESRGCLLELTWKGTEPIELPTGEARRFLNDGDEVILRGYCERDALRIGFGECRGVVLPADGTERGAVAT